MSPARGAQKGNLNALKHGYYSRLFRAAEADDLQREPPAIHLEQEIDLLRVMIRRTMELADGLDDLREATRVLDSLSAAASRLSVLLRAQKNLGGGREPGIDAIAQALKQVNQELRPKK